MGRAGSSPRPGPVETAGYLLRAVTGPHQNALPHRQLVLIRHLGLEQGKNSRWEAVAGWELSLMKRRRHGDGMLVLRPFVGLHGGFLGHAPSVNYGPPQPQPGSFLSSVPCVSKIPRGRRGWEEGSGAYPIVSKNVEDPKVKRDHHVMSTNCAFTDNVIIILITRESRHTMSSLYDITYSMLWFTGNLIRKYESLADSYQTQVIRGYDI